MLETPLQLDSDEQICISDLCSLSSRDSRIIMDVAVFRLTKKDECINEIIRYDLSDGYVEVRSGAAGMATIWDYDLVIMAISYLTQAMNLFNQGRGPYPGRFFSPTRSQINKFCSRGSGGRQNDSLEHALDRLMTTTIKVVRNSNDSGNMISETRHESLINSYRTLSRNNNGKLLSVEIELPRWIYTQVTEQSNAGVLQLHPDYFNIRSGIGRFVYRLARRAAGHTNARWSFRMIFERSNSRGSYKKFTQTLRTIIKRNNLPEYGLQEIKGKQGPILEITHRHWLAFENGTPPLEFYSQLMDQGFSKSTAIKEAQAYLKLTSKKAKHEG